MSTGRKKLLVWGIIITLIGLLLSALSPSLFEPLYRSIGRSDPLITFPLGILISLAQMALVPFGAALAGVAVALQILDADKVK